MINTGKSIDVAEGMVGGNLNYGAVAVKRGLDMIHNPKYDENHDTRAEGPDEFMPV